MEDFLLVIVVSLIITLLGTGSAIMIDKTWHHYQDTHAQHKQGGWKPPSIPVCDEELWIRIKDRCPSIPEEDEQHD